MRSLDFWRGRRVFITGASSGIGRALAEHVAGLGACVGLMARREEKLAELAAAIEAGGGTAAFAAVDVTDLYQVRAAVRVLEERLGVCDVMIANAGINRYASGFDFRAENANAVFATNVNGVVNAFGAVLPEMVARRDGQIVAIASIAALLGLPEAGAYSASKAAVVTMMKSLRVDLHGHGVKVTTICPGFVDTPLVAEHQRSILKFLLPPEEAARRIARAIARGRGEYWFPLPTWLMARVARAMPFRVYRWICGFLPPQPGGGEE